MDRAPDNSRRNRSANLKQTQQSLSHNSSGSTRNRNRNHSANGVARTREDRTDRARSASSRNKSESRSRTSGSSSSSSRSNTQRAKSAASRNSRTRTDTPRTKIEASRKRPSDKHSNASEKRSSNNYTNTSRKRSPNNPNTTHKENSYKRSRSDAHRNAPKNTHSNNRNNSGRKKQSGSADIIQKNMLPGSFASSLDGKNGWQQLIRWINKYTVGAVAVIAVVLFMWHPWAATPAQPEPEAPAVEETVPATLEEALEAQSKYEELSPTDFSSIRPTDKETTFGFTLAEGDAPTLSSESEAAINEVLAYYNENEISVGYILMDIESGRGFARNIDEKIYGASSFKGPFCAYLLMNKVESGEYKLTSSLRDGTTSKSGHFSFSGKDTLKNMVSDTIIYSDNGSFGALRSDFKDENLSSWLSSIGADSGIAYDEWYPHYTARDAARLWSATYNYLNTNTDGAQLLNDLYSSTETSFMRTAITNSVTEAKEAAEAEANNHVNEHGQYYSTEQLVMIEASGEEETTDAADATNSENGESASAETESGEAESEDANRQVIVETVDGDSSLAETADEELVLVRSKAGWYPGSSKSVSSISENGIVTLNGRDYLLCVMTNSYFNDKNTEHMHDLVNAVFNLRNDLVPAQTESEQAQAEEVQV